MSSPTSAQRYIPGNSQSSLNLKQKFQKKTILTLAKIIQLQEIFWQKVKNIKNNYKKKDFFSEKKLWRAKLQTTFTPKEGPIQVYNVVMGGEAKGTWVQLQIWKGQLVEHF